MTVFYLTIVKCNMGKTEIEFIGVMLDITLSFRKYCIKIWRRKQEIILYVNWREVRRKQHHTTLWCYLAQQLNMPTPYNINPLKSNTSVLPEVRDFKLSQNQQDQKLESFLETDYRHMLHEYAQQRERLESMKRYMAVTNTLDVELEILWKAEC